MHVALPRKWRPRIFEDLVGQEAVARTLENAIREKRIASAYLLTGPRGKVRALVIESRLPQAGQVSSASYEGDGYVIVRHADTAVVIDALRRLVTTVRVELGP